MEKEIQLRRARELQMESELAIVSGCVDELNAVKGELRVVNEERDALRVRLEHEVRIAVANRKEIDSLTRCLDDVNSFLTFTSGICATPKSPFEFPVLLSLLSLVNSLADAL